jgi:hypothetical protein
MIPNGYHKEKNKYWVFKKMECMYLPTKVSVLFFETLVCLMLYKCIYKYIKKILFLHVRHVLKMRAIPK